jgi:hypothetical protein
MDPVPFWLPAEHSVSYPQAHALPTGTPLRLPYPAVFVALASPWQLNPTAAEESPPSDAIRTLMLYARGRAARGQAETLATVLNRLHAAGPIDRTDLPTPLQAVSHYGGQVEGVILTADRDGVPEDDFAWCIAIGHPTGLPLGRIAVPASRANTAWRTQIDNVLAGIALSSWHEPGDAPPSRDGADALTYLNGRTPTSRSASSTSTTPHPPTSTHQTIGRARHHDHISAVATGAGNTSATAGQTRDGHGSAQPRSAVRDSSPARSMCCRHSAEAAAALDTAGASNGQSSRRWKPLAADDAMIVYLGSNPSSAIAGSETSPNHDRAGLPSVGFERRVAVSPDDAWMTNDQGLDHLRGDQALYLHKLGGRYWV